MSKKIITTITIGAILATASAFAYEGQKLEKNANIKMEEAKATALHVFNGKIEKAELEKEHGKLRYSFEIKKGKITREIGVDAKNGHIIENKMEKEGKDEKGREDRD